MLRNLLFALTAALVCAGTASASSLAYDGFDYIPGPLTGNNGGTGFATPWVSDPNVAVVPPGLSHPLGLASTGLEIGGFFNSARQLSSALSITSQYWASFQIRSDTGNDQVWLGLDIVPSDTPMVSFGRILNTYFIRQGGGAAVTGGVASPTGVTDLLVARFTPTGAVTNVDLWVNTADFTLPPVVSTFVPMVPYTWVNQQVQAGLFADEVRIGTTPFDVAVPEPASLGLLAFGAVALFARHRRRK